MKPRKETIEIGDLVKDEDGEYIVCFDRVYNELLMLDISNYEIWNTDIETQDIEVLIREWDLKLVTKSSDLRLEKEL